MTTTRRDFLQTLLALGGATAALSAVGCGDDDGPAGSDSGTPGTDAGRDSGTTPDEDAGTTPEEDAGTPPAECDVGATIDGNHGHVVTIPPADVAAGTERTYMIQGTSRHPHSITVSAAQFAMLAGGASVELSSTTNAGHSHAITLVCG